ncbi:hypothetical protein TrRE_jg13419 [Triparma retinervis]|uniref:Vps53 N-terminal domain-containing protein n=1 Tax=Triparma retinervis TaxID=2557542 RepID=A0A9W6ZXS5_9STRA|nr:hypothetical protein TrRE_jg13419 [Triparma retinervis]
MSFLSNSSLLEADNFDPLTFINSTFSTQQSLDSDLETFSSTLNAEITKLDASISNSIQMQSTASKSAAVDLKQAREASVQLRRKIEDVKRKALRSEEMVKVICADIKQLDFAKRHLQTTITALKRLHMLHNAVGQLSTTSAKRDFRAAALSLQATQALMEGFKDFGNVPKIKDLRYEVERVRRELSTGVFEAFEKIGSLASATANPNDFHIDDVQDNGGFTSLSEACLVVDALGKQARDKQCNTFCESQLKSYRKIFSPSAPHSGLDQIDRRFAWFRRLLKSIDERFKEVFPPHWHLQYKLCWTFLEQTSEGIMKTLEDEGNTDSENVIVIVKALQKTIMFEKEMTSRLEKDYGSSVDNTTVDPKAKYDNEMEYDEEGNEIDPRSAEGIKLRYARERAKRQSLSDKTGGKQTDKEDHALLPLRGMLSGVFLPFMGPYCQLEKQNLEELLQKAVADTETDQRGDLPVFTSAVSLFVYMKNSIIRGTALTTGVVFFNLYKEYKAALTKYAKVLQTSKMPAPYVPVNVMAGLAAARGEEKVPPNPRTSNYKIPPGEEETVCLAIDTCEYCVDTVEALEDLIKDKIDEGFKANIDLMDSQDDFNDVTSIGLRILVSGLDSRIEPFFKELTSTNWVNFDDVGEESIYVRNVTSTVTTFASTCQKTLPSSYYRSFCDKFASSFMTTFHSNLIKCKRFSQIATQQLLLDVYSLKKLIQNLPSINSGNLAPSMYATHTTKEFAKIEILLKLVGTPQELLVEVMRQQWPDGTLKDLQQVMSLRGMKRVQQTELLEAFGN